MSWGSNYLGATRMKIPLVERSHIYMHIKVALRCYILLFGIRSPQDNGPQSIDQL